MPVNNECPPLLKPSDLGLTIATSDVTLFDGNLTCVSVPANSTLNEVLAALDAAICDMAVAPSLDAADISYSGTTDFGCLTLSGTNLEEIVGELATAICVNDAAIDALATIVNDLCIDDIDLCNIINTDLYACVFGSVAPPALDPPNDNLGSLLSLMLQSMCTYQFFIDGGKSANNLTGKLSQSPGYASDVKSIINAFAGDTHDFTEAGGIITTSGSSFDVDIDDGSGGKSAYYVNGWGVDKETTELTMGASSDNYIDIREDGNYIITTVALAAPEPPVAASDYRLFKVVTDGSGVVSTEDRQTPYSIDGSTLTDDAIITRHIADGAITSDQLEDVVVGATVGDSDIFEITFDVKGRITAADAKINITALADEDVLRYDLGTDTWVNVQLSSIVFPVASAGQTLRYDGADWVASSTVLNTGTNVGIAVPIGNPLKTLTLGSGGDFALQMPKVINILGTPNSGGALAADTYFYIITALDTDGGETLVSEEEEVTVDGITETSIDFTWDALPLAKSYKIYRGTVSGTYTDSQEVSAETFTDDDSGWSADVTPTHTDSNAYSWLMTADGLRIGDGNLGVASFTVNSGLGKDFAMMVEAGFAGFKDSILLSDNPVTLETILPTSSAFGLFAEQSWNGFTCVHAINDDNAGNQAAASVFAGSVDGVSGFAGETIQMSYYGGSFVRTGSPSTPLTWFRNKGVIKAGDDVDGMILSVAKAGADLHFEMDGDSRMLLESGGSLGLGIDVAGATAVNSNSIFEMVSTSKGMMLPRWTTAQETTNTGSFGASEESMMWFNTDTSKFMGWDGTNSVILG